MSRIGRMLIPVPSGVEVEIEGPNVRVKGPKGTPTHTLAEPIVGERLPDGQIQVTRPDDENRSRALHGLSRTLVANMVTGVTEGYTKTRSRSSGSAIASRRAVQTSSSHSGSAIPFT